MKSKNIMRPIPVLVGSFATHEAVMAFDKLRLAHDGVLYGQSWSGHAAVIANDATVVTIPEGSTTAGLDVRFGSGNSLLHRLQTLLGCRFLGLLEAMEVEAKTRGVHDTASTERLETTRAACLAANQRVIAIKSTAPAEILSRALDIEVPALEALVTSDLAVEFPECSDESRFVSSGIDCLPYDFLWGQLYLPSLEFRFVNQRHARFRGRDGRQSVVTDTRGCHCPWWSLTCAIVHSECRCLVT